MNVGKWRASPSCPSLLSRISSSMTGTDTRREPGRLSARGGQSSGRENTRAPRVQRPGWRKSCSERLRHAEGPTWYTTQLNTDKNVSEEADRCLQEPPERAEDVNSQDPRGARDGPRSHRPEWRTRENALAEAAQAAPERWSLALTVTRLSWGSIKKI